MDTKIKRALYKTGVQLLMAAFKNLKTCIIQVNNHKQSWIPWYQNKTFH